MNKHNKHKKVKKLLATLLVGIFACSVLSIGVQAAYAESTSQPAEVEPASQTSQVQSAPVSEAIAPAQSTDIAVVSASSQLPASQEAGAISASLPASASATSKPASSVAADAASPKDLPGEISPAALVQLTYDGNGATGGTVPAPVTGNTGETIRVANHGSLVNEALKFDSWNTQPDGKGTRYQDVNGATFTFDSDTTLYAIWVEGYTTVTYTDQYTSGLNITLNGVPLPSEHTLRSLSSFGIPTTIGTESFDGWYLDATNDPALDGKVYQPGEILSLTKDPYVFTIVWKTQRVIAWDVAYVTESVGTSFYNGTNVVQVPHMSENETHTTLSSAALGVQITPPSDPELTKIFLHWVGVDRTTIYNPGDILTYSDTNNRILYAQYRTVIPEYRIYTYFENYGTIHDGLGEYVFDTKDDLGGNLIPGGSYTVKAVAYFSHFSNKPGYVLSNWNTQRDGNGTAYYPGTQFIEPVVRTPYTLYAQWVPIQSSNYTVAYNTQGGTPVPASETLAVGATLTKPANPTLAGSSFLGWYTQATGGTRWDFVNNTMPPNDFVLYAQYGSNTYIATFVYNDGTGYESVKQAAYGALLPEPTPPTRTAYTFNGWKAQDNALWNFTTHTMPAHNITLTAQWAALSQSGSSSSTITNSSSSGSPTSSSANGGGTSSSSGDAGPSSSPAPITSVSSASAAPTSTLPPPVVVSTVVSSVASSSSTPVAPVLNTEDTPTDIGTPPTPTDNIDTNPTPAAGPSLAADGWSLLNLMMSVLALAGSVLLLVRLLTQRRRNTQEYKGMEDFEYPPSNKTVWKWLAFAAGLAPALLFILLEDFSVMRFVNIHTPLIAAVFVLHMALLFVSVARAKHDSDDQLTAE